ncbi:MAG: hypothetical protein A3E83_01215 [Gammaproteobacteria bacterium RIFCSPHIGHO2_12_FULL_41_20]|nr:MAG: hypothetical protein A3E83_01215 [Gammaproteobacteria bacterium RIFCSPHIGHO2_12_FULL_41_20]
MPVYYFLEARNDIEDAISTGNDQHALDILNSLITDQQNVVDTNGNSIINLSEQTKQQLIINALVYAIDAKSDRNTLNQLVSLLKGGNINQPYMPINSNGAITPSAGEWETPMQCAKRNGDTATIALIHKHGGVDDNIRRNQIQRYQPPAGRSP